jgi:site-specific DNA-methyltransferase (adenine-specific)
VVVSVRILIGDCRERMAELDTGSIDSCVTDPPYHLTSIVKRFGNANAAPVKAGKTGAYVRASKGFMGQTWDGGDVAFQPETWESVLRVLKPGAHLVAFSGTRTYHRMACAIEDAGFEIRDQLAWTYGSGFPKSHNQPGGWGTALQGTVAKNVLAHGTGALNIDGCRIPTEDGYADNAVTQGINTARTSYEHRRERRTFAPSQEGRWPANIIHDGSEEVLARFPETTSTPPGNIKPSSSTANAYGEYRERSLIGHTDSGSAARFFYQAKATTEERGEGNNHPTVKPVDLMRWLCRLVTPAGGTVLDPFAGSGSTLIAADAEQFHAIGCELSPDYAAIAERRVRDAAGMFAEVQAA